MTADEGRKQGTDGRSVQPASSAALLAPKILVRITDDRLIGLWCDDCDEFVIVYNPQAERSHEVTAGDLHADARRHAATCGESDV